MQPVSIQMHLRQPQNYFTTKIYVKNNNKDKPVLNKNGIENMTSSQT